MRQGDIVALVRSTQPVRREQSRRKKFTIKLTTKIVGVVLAGTALCGLGTATASAATHDTTPSAAVSNAAASGAASVHAAARDSQGRFTLDLENDTRSSLVIYTYQGDDWDYAAGNSPVGTVIPAGGHASLVLRDHASAVDAVGISTTDSTLNLGMAIIQSQYGGGGSREQANPGNTLDFHETDRYGYPTVHITNQ